MKKKINVTITAVMLAMAIGGCSHTVVGHEKTTRDGTVHDLHPIVNHHGTAPELKADLPTADEIIYSRRRIDLENKFGWLKTRVSGNFKNAPLYTVLDLIIPEGRLTTFGDLDYRTPVSAEFDNTPLDIALDRILKPISADYIPHKNSIRITRTVKAVFRLAIPDVSNQATGMVGNMLTAGGNGMQGGGMGGGMQGGGIGSGMMGGGIGGGMMGGGMMGGAGGMQSGSSSGSSALLSVNSASGMTPFWQAIVSSVNGMVSGNCATPLATYTSGTSGGMMGAGMMGAGMQGGGMMGQGMQPGGMMGGQMPAGIGMPPTGGIPSPGFGPSVNGYGPAGMAPSNGSGIPGATPVDNRPGAVSPGSSFSGIACGHVKIDSNTGYIYVWDTVENVYDIGKYVEKVKKMLNKQVYLKVDIIEVQLNDQNQYGINWSAVANGLGAGLSGVFTGGAAANAGLATSGTSLTPYSLNLSNGHGVSSIIEALSTYGRAHIVNQPRILTVSGQPTTINVTQNIPYLQSEMPYSFGGLNSSSLVIPQIGYVTTGLTLEMLPEIEGGKVHLHVVPVLNTLTQLVNITVTGLGTFQEPEVDSRATSNDITVTSDQTVFFGGLIADSINDQYWSVPFLGSIPGVKWLFSGYNKIRQVDELVFVITPIITENGHKIETTIPSTHEMMHYHQDSNGIRLTPQKGIHVGPST